MTTRTIMAALLLLGLAAVGVVAFALKTTRDDRRDREDTCRNLGATPVDVGHNRVVCVNGRGQVVGPWMPGPR